MPILNSIDFNALQTRFQPVLDLLAEHWEFVVATLLLFATLVQLRELMLGLHSKAWPTVTGVIEKAWLTDSVDEENTTIYSAQVRYTYEVDGRLHKGHRIQFGRDSVSTSSHASENGRISHLHPGKRVPVRYHPNKPKLCTLEVGTSFWVIFFLLFTAIVSGSFYWAALFGFPAGIATV